MIQCEACQEVLGQSATIEPHSELKPLSGRRVGIGWHERYQCRDCKLVIQRIALPLGTATTHRWEQA